VRRFSGDGRSSFLVSKLFAVPDDSIILHAQEFALVIVWLPPFEGFELQWIPVDDDGAIALASALNVISIDHVRTRH
jgi:hypothetical protein